MGSVMGINNGINKCSLKVDEDELQYCSELWISQIISQNLFYQEWVKHTKPLAEWIQLINNKYWIRTMISYMYFHIRYVEHYMSNH